MIAPMVDLMTTDLFADLVSTSFSYFTTGGVENV
jgi:hypothetical protein|tara:strand:- start:57 stop:158 length:102 start_codon:yes stop_codon:yes gene_type:complete